MTNNELIKGLELRKHKLRSRLKENDKIINKIDRKIRKIKGE